MIFERPDKRIQLCWSVYALFAAAPSAALSYRMFHFPMIPRFATQLFTVAWCAALVFFLTIYFPLRRRRLRYRIDEDGITVITGVWFIAQRRIPLSAVRYFTLLSGPLERALGLTSLLIRATGSHLFIEGISIADAEMLTRRFL